MEPEGLDKIVEEVKSSLWIQSETLRPSLDLKAITFFIIIGMKSVKTQKRENPLTEVVPSEGSLSK